MKPEEGWPVMERGENRVSVAARTTPMWPPIRKGDVDASVVVPPQSAVGTQLLTDTLPASHVLLSDVSPHPYFPALQGRRGQHAARLGRWPIRADNSGNPSLPTVTAQGHRGTATVVAG